MTFKIGDTPFSNTATAGLAGAPGVNDAAHKALLRSRMWKDGMKEIYDIYPMTDPNVSSSNIFGDIGSFGKGLIDSGIFNKKEPSVGTQVGSMLGSYLDNDKKETSSNWWDGILGGWG